MLEAHRLNSPYLFPDGDRTFANFFLGHLRQQLGADTINKNEGLINRQKLAESLLKYDVGSLIHGVFLSNKVKMNDGDKDKKAESIAGGRLRIARALSAFVEAKNVRTAASGGVKNDHVNPSGVTKAGFGNVPFARDEYTGELTCYINLDLAQLRGYGLGDDATNLLILLSLHRVRRLLDGDLRLRTACDLEVSVDEVKATKPDSFVLPSLDELEKALPDAIGKCNEMVQETVAFEDELKKAKEKKDEASSDEDDSDEG